MNQQRVRRHTEHVDPLPEATAGLVGLHGEVAGAHPERPQSGERVVDRRLHLRVAGVAEVAERRGEVIERMAALAEQAANAGMTLVHENEKDIYGETPEHCRDLLEAVGSPALRMAFDPANFVQAGARPMEVAWPLLDAYVTHVHIKDAVFADGGVRPAGEGDGAVPELLAALAERGYQGFLTLEPHLKIAGPAGGFSGEAGMRTAVQALRGLLAAHPDVEIA